MKVRSSTYTLVVEFEGNPGLPSRVLDNNGFPWEVVFSKGDPDTGNVTVGIRPLREDPPTEVWELYPYSEHMPRVMEVRVYDYMSSVEALDVPIKQILSNPKDNLVLHDSSERRHVKDEAVPEGHVLLSGFGFLWGPLPLYPTSVPTKWPFSAHSLTEDREVTLTPKMSGTHYEVACGPLKISLPWHEGISFARLLTEMGWEDAVRERFPHGVRLMAPGQFDETEVSG